jgi:N-acetylmuramoyl-L-alanine amidase
MNIMQTILIFLCKSIVCSGLLFGYYLLALKNKKFHAYNRFYLLAAVVISLIAPLLHFEWYRVHTPQSQAGISVLKVISSNEVEKVVAGETTTHITLQDVLGISYAVVGILLLLVLLARIVWVYRLKRINKVIETEEFDIVYTNLDKAPFSFLNNLFWKNSIAIDSETGQQIFRHETTHIKEKHTLDKLFMQCVLVFCWINPIYWFMQKELSMIHEFVADEHAVGGQDTEAFAKMLLQSHYGNILPDIVHPFFYSPIKRRLIMLNRSNKTSYTYLRRLMVLPVAAVALALFSFTINKEELTKAKKEIVLVLDAGHGGADNGAVNGNIKEKDLTLMIVNRMADLAPEYNIEVVKTREGDNYPTLQERVDKANSIKADLFLSIHVNNDDNKARTNGFELIVSKPNVKYTDCKMLAAAISSKMNTMDINPDLVEKNLWVLKNNVHPAIAIEVGNINDAHNLAMMSDKAQLDKLCRNILSGIVVFKQK